MKAALDGTVIRAPMSGVHLSVRHELLSLIDALSEVRCLVLCGDGGVEKCARGRGAEIVRPPGVVGRVWARVLWQQALLPGLLARRRVDVFHALAYTAPLRCPVPYVLNVHDIIALEHPELCSRLNVWHMRLLLPASARRASATIVSTQHVADRLRSVVGVPSDRTFVVPLGVDDGFFSAAAEPPRLPNVGGAPYLLFLGNLEPKKGILDLLDAFERIRSHSDLHLVIAGRAAWRSAPILRRLRHLTEGGRATWLGRVSAASLPGLYQHAFAYVFPSVEEGFGMPVLEAMAAGTPVLHSDHPAVLEAAGGAGLSFRRHDPADLAEKVLSLWREKHRPAELRAAGRQHAAARAWSKWGEAAAQILSAAAGGG